MKQNAISFFFFFLALNLMGQNTLTGVRNYFRHGDFIVKQQVEYKDPGSSGKEIEWNFSHLNVVNEKYQQAYFLPVKGDTTHIVGLEHDTRYHYEQKADTLWFTGFENRTTQMTYQQPEAWLRFPFRLGDTLTTCFSGAGLYCQRVDLTAKGKTMVVADATGKLITPDNDTLKNVIRIRRIKEFTDIGVDSVKMRLETYQWFALGSRYPVFETVKSYNVLMDTLTENFSTSFYFSSICREQLPADIANINIKAEDISVDNILINCNTYPNPVVNDLTINYELSVNAGVSFLLCDMSARPWVTIPTKPLNAGVQQQKISMSGLQLGNYALYITVNNKTFKRVILKV